MGIERYITILSSLRLQGSPECRAPHRAAMLIAVLELFESRILTENRIIYGPPLLEIYGPVFDCVKCGSYQRNPFLPYFHLRGATQAGRFWHLIAKPGRELVAEAIVSRTRWTLLIIFSMQDSMMICLSCYGPQKTEN
jgi:putative restriction endonuclease